MTAFKRLVVLGIFMASLGFLSPSSSYADGCYICGPGSSNACKHYCRYKGSDTWANRKKCMAKGCKVTGTTSCPSAANYKVCNAY